MPARVFWFHLDSFVLRLIQFISPTPSTSLAFLCRRIKSAQGWPSLVIEARVAADHVVTLNRLISFGHPTSALQSTKNRSQEGRNSALLDVMMYLIFIKLTLFAAPFVAVEKMFS